MAFLSKAAIAKKAAAPTAAKARAKTLAAKPPKAVSPKPSYQEMIHVRSPSVARYFR